MVLVDGVGDDGLAALSSLRDRRVDADATGADALDFFDERSTSSSDDDADRFL